MSIFYNPQFKDIKVYGTMLLMSSRISLYPIN